MKILYDYQIACAQKYGGVSRYHYELMQGLNRFEGVQARMGIIFSANYYFSKGTLPGPALGDGKKWRIPGKINKAYLMAKLRFGGYDIFHPTWYDDGFFPSGCKMVITVHDMIQELFWKGPEELIRRKKEYMDRADHIIAISENTKKDILELYPDIPEEKISIVYHGTNHLPAPKMPSGWDPEKRYILFVGSRRTYKNAMTLVREISEVLLREDIFLVFAGAGLLDEKETGIVREAGISDRVIQRNVSDGELAYLYQNALCFIFPSAYEGFGFPLLEAFDNGCPVLCHRGTSLPEVGGDAAMYFDIGVPGDLREKLEAFLGDESLREMLVAAGKERCAQFTWEKAAAETLACYQKILDK